MAGSIAGILVLFAVWASAVPWKVAADDAVSAILKTDAALQMALSSKDAKATSTFLDRDFTWTNKDGKTSKTAEFVKYIADGGGQGADYKDLKAREYSQLAIVTGRVARAGQPEVFFARVWVKRPAGWLLLTHQSTVILVKGSPSPQMAAGNWPKLEPGCENPCRMIPYKPKTAADGEVAKAYQAVETAVTSHDAKTWGYHVADEFVGIGRQYYGKPDAKQERMDQIGSSNNVVILPKMLWGEVYVFGDSAIMIADHQPSGEPPYHVIRVWVNREGRWQLFHRQETTILQPVAAS